MAVVGGDGLKLLGNRKALSFQIAKQFGNLEKISIDPVMRAIGIRY